MEVSVGCSGLMFRYSPATEPAIPQEGHGIFELPTICALKGRSEKRAVLAMLFDFFGQSESRDLWMPSSKFCGRQRKASPADSTTLKVGEVQAVSIILATSRAGSRRTRDALR